MPLPTLPPDPEKFQPLPPPEKLPRWTGRIECLENGQRGYLSEWAVVIAARRGCTHNAAYQRLMLATKDVLSGRAYGFTWARCRTKVPTP